MQKCRICGSTDFFKEAGYFFCQTCQTQNEDIREEVLELRVDSSTRLRKTRIRQLRSDKSGEEVGWTSWELYNFVLIGLTNELIELGTPSDIKLTILQLWATYLSKVEVAFTSMKKKDVPKLARRYNKRDAEIIYGKVQAQRKSRKRKRPGSSTTTSMISSFQSEGSSARELNKNKKLLITADYDRYMQSQASSEGDAVSSFTQSLYSVQSSSVKSSDNEGRLQFSSHAKDEINKIKKLSKNVERNRRAKYKEKHISTQYRTGPHVITPMRLWAIIYLALRIHNQPIHLADMLRYGREGHLSYYKLDHLLPPEIQLTKSETNFLSQNVEITHKGMRRIIASMAKLLGVWDIICPDLLPLVSRYCQELGLPRGILLYTERLIALAPPKMTFDGRKSYIPNYEGRAIAFIIVVLKTLFGLDGITECQISRVAEKINRVHGKLGEGECKCNESSSPRIIVHGGAGSFSDSIIIEKMTACKKAASNGYKKLMNGENSVEAVEAALWWLECDEFFNCSYGSVLNVIGKVQMDASIMDGLQFKCGSVAAVSDIEHPISLAKYVMKHFPNSIFVGEGAKNLAKHANLNWISEGNMVAPLAHVAYKLEETGKYEPDCDIENLQCAESLTNSCGTVGCVAYDGYSIAAGTTTGGLNRKLVGRVGDTPILGCGTYANRNVGCSLTGHGESIVKLGLSRAIVEDIEQKLTAEEALQKNFSYMLNKFETTGGGIVIQSNGCWATHFTSDKMPYAVIEDDLITFGARPNEKRTEIYYDPETKNSIATERGLLGSKLFSFREWQRYIECRKTILVHSHFPTKLKYSPDTHGIDSLYVKFLEFINSKGEREEPEVTNHKHFLPEELVSAMKKYIHNLSDNDPPAKEIDVFPPSLTPLHSYLQQLLNHPLYDLPNIVRNDFFLTKVGYMTKPDAFMELAMQCNIQLDIIDSNLHFLEKIVPPFEQARMPSIEELKQPVEVEDDVDTERVRTGKSESFNEYVHRKTPCKIRLDVSKQQYYDNIRSSVRDRNGLNLGDDFTFTELLPNGRLAIPSNNDPETEDSKDGDNINQEGTLLETKFCEKYNVHLSRTERGSILKPEQIKNVRFKKKSKAQSIRNPKGQFVKGNNASVKEESSNENDPIIERSILISEDDTNQNTTKQESNDLQTIEGQLFAVEDINLNDIDIDNLEDIDTTFPDFDNYFNLSDISLLSQNNEIPASTESRKESASTGGLKFFRPFKDYWMYHCIFSRVKQKNFESFEKVLPRSFRWLLNECAHIVEMSTEDLYEEVCLIETYHAHIFKSATSGVPGTCNVSDPKSKLQSNLILSKW